MSEIYSKQNRNKTKVKTLKHSSSLKKAKLALSAGKVFISVCLLKSQTITKKWPFGQYQRKIHEKRFHKEEKSFCIRIMSYKCGFHGKNQ
jgi:hypothetical protein